MAESAADVGRHDAKVALAHAQKIRNAGAQHVRHLHGGGERDPAGGPLKGGMRGARLERHGALAVRADLDLDDPVGGSERRIEAFGPEPAVDQKVAGHLGMHLRRARRERPVEIDNGVLRLDLDEYQLGNVLGLLGARCHHRGDRLADMVDAGASERRLGDRHVIGAVQQRPNRADIAEIGGGDHAHPRGQVVRDVDPQDAAARDRAAHEADCRRALREVGDEAAVPGQEHRVLEARDRPTDPAHASAAASARRVITCARSRRYAAEA